MLQTVPLRLAAVGVACVSLAVAGEKWSRLDYTALTASEAQKILNDSPWAKEAQATIVTPKREAGPDDVPMPAPANQPPSAPKYSSDDYGVNDGSWDGGVARRPRAYNAPTVPVLVRWDSAVPVREALLKTKDPDVRDTENTVSRPEKDYILTVIGLVPERPPQGGGTDGDDRQTPEQEEAARRAETTRIRQGVLDSTRLRIPGKPPIRPEDVRVDNSGVLQIYFPKTAPITLADKEVVFDSRYGALQVVQPFRLKDMLVNGQPAL